MHCSMSFSHKLANGKTRRVMSREEFRLLHYAGEVNYNVNGKMKFISRSQLPNFSPLRTEYKT